MAIQERDVVFALDIGTRSIVGVLGREEGGRLRVIDIEKEEHGRRAMLDGQIEDIAQVAAIARTVVERLEARQHIRLQRVCVAAAGRALRSARASFTLEFAESRQATDETINQLEAGAVSAAESTISNGEGGFYMVGYTPAQYRVDGYPLSTLHGHRGRVMEVDVVATFLPREVVDSLYAVVGRLGLEVSSLTLEPIASLNAAIPLDIRLLNLVLVDIGAGTSDIAVCRNGSVAGYTMATVAGDEVTELLMKQLLIDFRTAETLKTGIGGSEPLRYTDILGIVHECTSAQLTDLIEPAVRVLAEEIAGKVLELNGGVPSAAFLAGGGSKLFGLREAVAIALGMDDARVAIAGNHFEKNAFSDAYSLDDPEYSTPLGIAISAALGMIHDSYVVTLNGQPAKLFRSGTLTVRDVLLMNGSSYSDLMGRTGANLAFTLNGARQFIRGMPGSPPAILLNGETVELSAVVHAGDSVTFQPAKAGANASRTLEEVVGEGFTGGVTVNGEPRPLDYVLHTGDAIDTTAEPKPMTARKVSRRREPPAEPPKPDDSLPVRAHATVHTAGEPLEIDVPITRRRETAQRAQKLAFENAAPEFPQQDKKVEKGQGEAPAKTPRTPAAKRERRGRRERALPTVQLSLEEPAMTAEQPKAEAAALPAEAAPVPQPVPAEPLPMEPSAIGVQEAETPETEAPQAVPPAFAEEPVPAEKPAETPAPAEPDSPAEGEREPAQLAAEALFTGAPVPAEEQPEEAAEPDTPAEEQPEEPMYTPVEEPQEAAPLAEGLLSTEAPDLAEEPPVPAAQPEEPSPVEAAEPEPQPQPVPLVVRRDPNAPKRHGVPRVILPDLPEFRAAGTARPLTIRLNGAPLVLQPKESGEPHYFMDVLQHSGLDFNHLQRPVELLLNGAPCDFTRKLTENDEVVIRYQETEPYSRMQY